jgi:hypothetical protein
VSLPGADVRCCSFEEIFELCEGSLERARERAVLTHLRECPECQSLHAREMSLSLALTGNGGRAEAGSARGDTASSVAMAIPTRSAVHRAVWGVGAAGLLVLALLSLSTYSVWPVTLVTEFMATSWSLTSGASDAAGILIAVSGSTILVALIVGALVDTLIAATLLAVARWWRPRGA